MFFFANKLYFLELVSTDAEEIYLKFCRKCEKVNVIADDLQLRQAVWKNNLERIPKILKYLERTLKIL